MHPHSAHPPRPTLEGCAGDAGVTSDASGRVTQSHADVVTCGFYLER